MSWFSDRWGHGGIFGAASDAVERNRDSYGNLLKNVAPLAAFTPLGGVGAGAVAALGQGIQHGSNLGDILKSGASGAALGSAAHTGVLGLQSLLSRGGAEAAGSAIPDTALNATDAISNGMYSGGGAAIPDSALRATQGLSNGLFSTDATSAIPSALPDAAGAGLGSPLDGLKSYTMPTPPPPVGLSGGVVPSSPPMVPSPSSWLDKLGNGLKGTADFAERHPNGTGYALKALGSSLGSEGDLQRAQAARIRQQIAKDEAEQAAMEPLRRLLAQTQPGYLGGGYTPPKPQVSTNPYFR